MADATNTTNPSRRSLLSFLAAATTAAPVAAIATSLPAQAAATATQELPELLAAGEDVTAAIQAYRLTKQRMAEAAALFERLCPPCPADLYATAPDKGISWGQTVPEANYLTGEPIGTRKVYDSKSLRLDIIRHDLPSTTREGRRLRRLARLATKFERERDEAYRASGHGECSSAIFELADQLYGAARPIKDMEPVTMAGAMVCARAVIALGEILDLGWDEHRSLHGKLGNHVAAALLRIEGGAQ